MNEMTVKAVITADSVLSVEGDSYEPVGEIHAIDDPTPVTIAPGSLFERYLRTIDLCNDSQLIKGERAVENHRRPDRGGAEGAGGEGHSAAVDQRTAQ